MQDIQEVQKQYNIAAEYVVNLDETGIFYGAAPKYIFEAHGARSCAIPDHDEKSRFTVELAAAGDGNILPYFIVIKCSVPSGSNPYDFGSMRVIHNLHTEPAFNASAGWSLKKWEGFKTTRRKKNGQPVQQGEEFEHVRLYLQHVDGHVITCQPKAWMDTGGLPCTFRLYWRRGGRSSRRRGQDLMNFRLSVFCWCVTMHLCTKQTNSRS
jgi:hypothetical protein